QLVVSTFIHRKSHSRSFQQLSKIIRSSYLNFDSGLDANAVGLRVAGSLSPQPDLGRSDKFPDIRGVLRFFSRPSRGIGLAPGGSRPRFSIDCTMTTPK